MATKNKPELHQPALQLIADVLAAHKAGQGELSLLALALTFSSSLSDDDKAKLEQRGAVKLERVNDAGGKFSNQGPKIEREEGSVKVTIPDTLKGTYTASATECKLSFNSGNTISGKKSGLQAKLKSVKVDQTIIFADTDAPFDLGDTRIKHG
jgi:hypothetical protein